MANKTLTEEQRRYLEYVINIFETKYASSDIIVFGRTAGGLDSYSVKAVSGILQGYLRDGFYGEQNHIWLNDLPRALNLTKL